MTTGVLAPDPILRFCDNRGNPLVGGSVLTQVGGVNTATYSNVGLTTPLPNPIILNSRGEIATSAGASAQCFLTPNTVYTFTISDANGNQIWVATYVNGVQVDLTGAEIGQLLWPQTPAELAASITPADYQFSPTPFYDMQRYGIVPNGVDNSAIVQAVYNMAKVSGGTLVFPPNGDYAFYLDISGGGHAQVFIEGQGSNFRPFTATPLNSCVIFADNSGSSYSDTYVRFRNCNIESSLYSAESVGVVNYGVYHKYACSRFYNVHMTYALIANFYSLFGQYGEFWDCRFDYAVSAITSAGVILDSDGLAASTNEVNFVRCEFFNNANGLWLKGAQKTRLLDCTIQGNGISGASGGIVLDADSTSSQTGGTDIIGCWFELNSVDNIFEATAYNTAVISCMFWSTGGVNIITFTHCSGITFIGNQWPGAATVTINHPSGNTDCASLLWRGNMHATVVDMIPTLNINHPGTYSLDLHWSGSFTGTLTGCTTAPTATVNYTVEGDCVDLHLPSAGLTATSNSTACTVTGLPAAISPLSTVYGLQPFLEDATATFIGQVSIANGGTVLTLYKAGSATGFTNSGTKGINGGGIFRYPLFT